MAFNPETKNPGDLVKSKDWNEAMQAIIELFGLSAQLVDASKIQDGAVVTSKLQDNAVANSKLQDGAVTNSKILDGSITANKIAPGVISGNIGITVTLSLTNGAAIPIPNGFTKEECVFFAFMKFMNYQVSGFQCYAQDGKVILALTNAAGQSIPDPAPGSGATFQGYATAVAIAKEGGWA